MEIASRAHSERRAAAEQRSELSPGRGSASRG